jgi:hypothetical protein
MSERNARREYGAAKAYLQAELRRHCREIDRLRVENEILCEAAEPLIHRAAAGSASRSSSGCAAG